MNRFIWFLLVNSGIAMWGSAAFGQNSTIMGAYGPGYAMVTSYSGTTIGGHQLHFQLNTPMNVPNWSVRARINAPIYITTGRNVSGQPFPADKLSFKFTGTGTNTPTPAQINVPMNPQPLQVGRTVLIASSAAPLVNDIHRYHEFRIDYELIIEGGAYLDQMKSIHQYEHVHYRFPIVFELFDGQGRLLSTYTQSNPHIQIHPNLSGEIPGPPEPAFSLEIMGDAVDGTLNFNNLQSYINGVSVLYPDAVKIHAQTGFELTVYSRHHQFISNTGQTLPVEVLQVRLQQGSSSPATAQYFTTQASTQPGLLLRRNQGSTTPLLMDLEYRTEGLDQRLMDADAGKYSTVLVYQLIPR